MNDLPPPPITLATSIAPKRIELQQKTADSWLALGFNVISFNTPDEIHLLQPLFPNIHFISVTRDGRANCGRPLVYVQDVLDWFRQSCRTPWGGFVNSDIFLAPELPQFFLATINREINGSLLFSRRIETENLDERSHGRVFRVGFDFWLWDNSILDCFQAPNEYLIGQPHWDYYMELAPLFHAIKVKQLYFPHAYHQSHATFWNAEKDYFRTSKETAKQFQTSLASLEEFRPYLEYLDSRDFEAHQASDPSRAYAICCEFSEALLKWIDDKSLMITQPSTSISIATSIAPKGLDLQHKAIASWQKLGFKVLSFNNAAEVAQLAPQFPEVRFITVSRDGTARSGKPLVYVQDILAWFREHSGIRYGGFINSDIVVAPEDPASFKTLLEREIKGSLIFSRRIEVAHIDTLDGKWNRTGIDLWLWDREILHCYTEPADYMVGFPHWDYYMELMPICHGIPVKQLAVPNAYHQTHDAYYDWVRDAVPFALTTFKLIYPYLDRIPDKDHLLLPTINYCFKHQPAQISSQDDLEFLAMFLNTLDKFFLETIDRCSLKLNYSDMPHVPQDNRLPLCHNPQGYMQPRDTMTKDLHPRPMARLPLGTSLSPFDTEKQKIAVASWIAHGFEPISFNNATEVAQLTPLYPEVRFVTLTRDGFAIAQRPLPYVDDIVAWFRQSGLPYGGFINADIIIKPSQPAVFQDLIRRQLPGSMLFARRIEIEATAKLDTFWDTLQGLWVRSGIDLWLFDTALLSRYTFTTDYLIGYPHWDYFMCMWPLANGYTLKEIAAPSIFHVTHEQRYDFSNQMRYAMKTYMHIAPMLNKFPVLDRALLKFVDFFARHQPSNSQDEYGQSFYSSFRYALDTLFLETIYSNCKRISYVHADGIDDVVPGYNHPLHSFGTLEVVLHRNTP